MISLQSLTPAPVATPKASAAATGAAGSPGDPQPDPAGFAALLAGQRERAADAAPAADEIATECADCDVPAAPAITAAGPGFDAALAISAPPAAAPPAVDPSGQPGAAALVPGLRAGQAAAVPGEDMPATGVAHGRANAGTNAPRGSVPVRDLSSEASPPPAAQAASQQSRTADFEPIPAEDGRAAVVHGNAAAQFAARIAAPNPLPNHGHQLEAPVGSARWSEQLANEVVVLVREGAGSAVIQVTPPELGPVRAEIRIADGVASVVLSASAHETREALDAAIPTLRDALAESGIALGETSVSDERLRQQGERQAGRARAEPGAAASAEDAPPASRRLPAGLLDLYA